MDGVGVDVHGVEAEVDDVDGVGGAEVDGVGAVVAERAAIEAAGGSVKFFWYLAITDDTFFFFGFLLGFDETVLPLSATPTSCPRMPGPPMPSTFCSTSGSKGGCTAGTSFALGVAGGAVLGEDPPDAACSNSETEIWSR